MKQEAKEMLCSKLYTLSKAGYIMKTSSGFNFNIFGFSVQVDWSFFLMALILGSSLSDLDLLAIWIAAVFISVLAHELGHAFAAQKYGMAPWIELYSGGGLTHSQHSYPLSHFERITLSLAGPAAGFLFAGIVWFIRRILPDILISRYLWAVMAFLLWINVVWGILNLLPILPLDGGNVMRTLVHRIQGNADDRLPLQISIGTGIVIFILAIVSRHFWGAILCGWFTYRNYQQLQHISSSW
jgi:Zn-dependent protease